MKLSKTQREIYRLLTEEYLSVEAIANRRQTTDKAVYKTIKILKEKGLFSKNYKPYKKERGTIQPFFKKIAGKRQKIRLHGQQFRIKIISKSRKYLENRQKCNKLVIKGCSVLLHRHSISIFDKNSYFGDNETEALGYASEFIDRLFWILEDRFNIIICKSEFSNAKIVRSHYAETHNGLAKDLHSQGKKLKIRTNEDGKIWLEIDNSFNMHEAEFKHPDSSLDDTAIMHPFFNDLRENPNLPLRSEHFKMTKNLVMGFNKISEILTHVVPPAPDPAQTEQYEEEKPYYFG